MFAGLLDVIVVKRYNLRDGKWIGKHIREMSQPEVFLLVVAEIYGNSKDRLIMV